MVIGIFGKNMDEGNRFFDDIVGEIKYKDIKEIKTFPRLECILTDGTTYKVLPSNGASRGYKVDKAFISRNVSKEFMEIQVPFLFVSDECFEYFN